MTILPHQAIALAHAVVDRLAFAAESAAVALAVVLLLCVSAARFDFLAAALVWGNFLRRLAEVDDAARIPVLIVVGSVLLGVTIAVAFVRLPRARVGFAAFPDLRSKHAGADQHDR